MLNLTRQSAETVPAPICYFTSSTLPQYLDHAQLSMKKRPFSTIQGQPFNHTLNIVLPFESGQRLQKSLKEAHASLAYSVVYMKLGDLVTGDFFNQYIKTGNIMMLSEGRPSLDPTFSLYSGILRLEVDKATFERLGLEGKSIRDPGRKHIKTRYVVELNLRLPSMIKGKSGFERILWAFRNVLNQSLKWLFYDLQSKQDDIGPIAAHQPQLKRVEAQCTTMKDILVPAFPAKLSDDDSEQIVELLEWITLAVNDSPRILAGDDMDPILSRYRVPSQLREGDNSPAIPPMADLMKLEWQGLIPPSFIQKILLAAIKAAGTQDWFAVNACAFDGASYTFLQQEQHTMTWEYRD